MRTTNAAGATGLALIVLLAGCTSPEAPPTPQAEATAPSIRAVSSIAVVGDSMSVGMAACGTRDACPAASWALGTDADVSSIRERVSAASGGTEITPLSLARPGAAVADRITAVEKAKGESADLVLVAVGTNDVCTSSMDEITPVDAFGESYGELLETIRAGVPGAPIVATSLPDISQLWAAGRDDSSIVSLWNQSPSCRTLLGDADSDAASDEARRASVMETWAGYNTAIAAACAAVTDCTTDDGAISRITFSLDDISTADHFHPSASGQAKVAEAAWPAVQRALGG
ncbi:lysophospholipase L1-like esterase [Microbacterium sp. SORGH_AS 1204]|uniref:SGNH/GDSL hydrolase family protein n=1 Tax=Microbacterium sp. SORGH_AS_1204 TaxID=3041785 RepID=UPI00278CC92F|nr:SGNH/GDSL hydrolase family protein [Microbacterium sp. SORGH_AS_1204]MDQ1136199.1 lysophospholipase L1-like esterase [Microbacterium sp. SORGH_AS_1204]